jgi:hypothetical protein
MIVSVRLPVAGSRKALNLLVLSQGAPSAKGEGRSAREPALQVHSRLAAYHRTSYLGELYLCCISITGFD